ncbi:hypothetical protein ACFY97_18740 [Streptomyces klenkii]|uniref:hypothetical protein n=1 Tax=Streptomyces klenkii TaxID=1420899 RepID=UPI0036F0C191
MFGPKISGEFVPGYTHEWLMTIRLPGSKLVDDFHGATLAGLVDQRGFMESMRQVVVKKVGHTNFTVVFFQTKPRR